MTTEQFAEVRIDTTQTVGENAAKADVLLSRIDANDSPGLQVDFDRREGDEKVYAVRADQRGDC